MAEAAPRVRRRGWRRALLALALLCGAAASAIAWFADPGRLTALVTRQVESRFGATLTTAGSGRFSFLPGLRLSLPQPVLGRDGDTIARADTLELVLPWSTLRARGSAIDRVDLVRPVLDVEALRRWLAARPPSSGSMPDLRFALHVVDGTLIGAKGVLARGIDADFATTGDVAAWLAALRDAPADAPLLPPARGTLEVATLEAGDARIEGLHVELHDEARAAQATP
jgi:hypothetical protein